MGAGLGGVARVGRATGLAGAASERGLQPEPTTHEESTMAGYNKRYRSFEDFEREELNDGLTLEDLHENLFDFVEDLDVRDDEGDAAELPF